MEPETVEGYKRVLVNLVNTMVKEQIPFLFETLGNLSDPGDEIRKRFDEGRISEVMPVHWISVLRFIHFCQVLHTEVSNLYDEFVATYQTLSHKGQLNDDEAQLQKEIGDLLYRVDDAQGRFERQTSKLMEDLQGALAATYGLQFTPTPEFFKDHMSGDDQLMLQPQLVQLAELCKDFLELSRLMSALDRIRRLISM